MVLLHRVMVVGKIGKQLGNAHIHVTKSHRTGSHDTKTAQRVEITQKRFTITSKHYADTHALAQFTLT